MSDVWPLIALLYVSASDRLPEPPEFREYPSVECERCGRQYFGDPYDAPSYCDRCGGKMKGFEQRIVALGIGVD